jgi:hypothetical protein
MTVVVEVVLMGMEGSKEGKIGYFIANYDLFNTSI